MATIRRARSGRHRTDRIAAVAADPAHVPDDFATVATPLEVILVASIVGGQEPTGGIIIRITRIGRNFTALRCNFSRSTIFDHDRRSTRS